MRFTILCLLALVGAGSVHADFSYQTSRKTTGGTMAAMAGGAANQPTKYYLKGQKMKVETGDTATILDFEAQTFTTINNAAKTVTIQKFDQMNAAAEKAGVEPKVTVSETGQKKVINGFNASQLVITMDIESPQARQMGSMQAEIELWLSPDVPGASEQSAFYKRNASRFPWAAMGGGAGNQSMQSAMAELQKKVATMNGVQVEQVFKIKAPAGAGGAPAMPQMTPAQQAQMASAMAQMEAMRKQGGPQAAAAEQAMARMGGMGRAMGGAPGGAPGGAASGNMLEMTMDSSDFSTASIPDSVFAIPAGYQQK